MKLVNSLLMLGGIVLILYLLRDDFFPVDKPQDSSLIFQGLSLQDIQGLRAEFAGGSYEIVRVKTTLAPEERLALNFADSAERWVLFFPPGAPVEHSIVETILQNLINLRGDYSFSESDTSEGVVEMGLMPPELQLRLTTTQGPKVVFFGRQHPLTARRYLQVEGENTIYLVNDAVFQELRRTALGIRITRLLPISPLMVEKLNIKSESGSELILEQSLEKDIGAQNTNTLKRPQFPAWSVSNGEKKITADSELVELMFSRISGSVVESYIDGVFEPEVMRSLSQPKYVLNFTLRPGELKESAFGRSKIEVGLALGDFPAEALGYSPELASKYYLLRFQSSPWAYVISRAKFALVQLLLEDWSLRRLWPGDVCGKLEVLSAQQGGRELIAGEMAKLASKFSGLLCSMEILNISDAVKCAENSPQFMISGRVEGHVFSFVVKGLLPESKPPVASKDSQGDAPHFACLIEEGAEDRNFVVSGAVIAEFERLMK